MRGRVLIFAGCILAGMLRISQALPAVSSSGGQGQIAFISTREGGHKLFVMNAHGSSVRRVVDMDAAAPAWSPDGKRILFSSGEGEEVHLYTIDASGGGLRQITSGQTYNYGASWSPDGTRIVFASRTKGKPFSLYIANADGSMKRRLTKNPKGDYSPAWSPDGKRIAFERSTGGNRHIAVVSTDGTNLVALTPKDGLAEAPAWSPEGARLTFRRYREDGREICIMNADGTGLTIALRTPGPYGGMDPAWSPDGTHLVVDAIIQGGVNSLYTMRTDGSELTRLSTTRFIDSSPAWAPTTGAVAAAQAQAPAQRSSSLPPQAQEAIARGLTAAKGKDYRQAIRHFEEARKNGPYAPEVLFNLGLAESRMPGRELAAMVWLKAFLAASPDAPQAEKVRDLYGRLETSAKATIARLLDLQKELVGKLPNGQERDEAFSRLSGCQARAGDFAGARRSADQAGSRKAKAYTYIAYYQADRGDLAGARRSAELSDDKRGVLLRIELIETGMRNYNSAMVMPEIAESEARKGDIPSALKMAAQAGDSRDLAYARVAYTQALQGDTTGGEETANRISDPSARQAVLRRIEIVRVLAGAGDSKNLRERVNVLFHHHKIIDTLNSASFPWFADLPGYLKTLHAKDSPLEIEWGVRKVLVDETGGMITNLDNLKNLGKSEG